MHPDEYCQKGDIDQSSAKIARYGNTNTIVGPNPNILEWIIHHFDTEFINEN